MIDFTFCAVDLNINSIMKNSMLIEVLNVPFSLWHFNEFRGCYMLPIFNGGGRLGPRVSGINTSKGEMNITEAGKLCPTLVNFIDYLEFMEPIGRITILRTLPGQDLNIHLDSNIEEIGTSQHKFRMVLNGDIDRLYFVDDKDRLVTVPNCYDTYILDGTHPHGLFSSNREKITLCVGAPWFGKITESYQNILNSASYIMKVSRPNKLREEWLDPFFRK